MSDPHIDVRAFVVETEPCVTGWSLMDMLAFAFALLPETCAQLRLGRNIIHLHLMAIAFECGEL